MGPAAGSRYGVREARARRHAGDGGGGAGGIRARRERWRPGGGRGGVLFGRRGLVWSCGAALGGAFLVCVAFVCAVVVSALGVVSRSPFVPGLSPFSVV